ncbi:ABC transporter permease subunit [Mesobacillus zeae]|uniref:ABC transporter permease n=1 Tax=Mesobacillus zeae TaxID=1917180 RepID=A0A398BAA0_9BACI|nr:ABC transporter permease subunit [Mesobacillus zeae]RID86782.1 ABC transporter permease [Mesobacillus zeae]
MNIYRHELKAYRKSTIIWTFSLIGLTALFLSMFPSISKDAEQFGKLLEGYPEAVRKAIGLELDTFFSFLGFYSYTFLYITLAGAIQAMNLGLSVFSKEMREKTADFLLTKPVTREKVFLSKLLAALTSLLVTNVAFFAASFLISSRITTEDYSGKAFLLISLTLLFIQLIFLALGLFISVFARQLKNITAVSFGTVFGFFLLGMLSSTSGSDGAMRLLSPFKYFDTAYIIRHGEYEWRYILAASIIVLVSAAMGLIIFKKKDIHSV